MHSRSLFCQTAAYANEEENHMIYKKVKQYALNNGFTAEDKNGLVYGQMNGFFFSIHQDPVTAAKHTVYLWVKEGSIAAVPAITDFLNLHRFTIRLKTKSCLILKRYILQILLQKG